MSTPNIETDLLVPTLSPVNGSSPLFSPEEKKEATEIEKSAPLQEQVTLLSLEEHFSSSMKHGIDVTVETALSEISDPGDYRTRRTGEIKDRTDDEEDEDSSNDDSSYFADPSNLPSPKSGGPRHHANSQHSSSIASANAAHNAASSSSAYNKESDASLSLSDDSDEGHHGHHRVVPPELYPHPITRIHSVSSLVSTSSQNSSEADELRQTDTPSGRRSPVMGHAHPYLFPSPIGGMQNPLPSPPPIRAVYQSQSLPHPQPQHVMTPEEMKSWVALHNLPWSTAHTNASSPYGGASTDNAVQSTLSKDSTMTYSVDSDLFMLGNGGTSSARTGDSNKLGINNPNASGTHAFQAQIVKTKQLDEDDKKDHIESSRDDQRGFTVYWQRWLMLMYMSVLNLLSDWTCYSVAPIALLTREAFGRINAEQLVVVFLTANAVGTACEPIILSRLGLRRTVLFGALLLMVGSIVKSGGMPPIIQADLEKGQGEWRVYLGFFVVGLSQPLYQCTPALLSASWFPEQERTMATGVALNSNQVGIGFAFIFGTMLVSHSDDIPSYFGLLSIIATITFLGVLIQFDDAPPTPPSDTARVMRGTFEVNLPSMRSIFQTVRNIGSNLSDDSHSKSTGLDKPSRSMSGDSEERDKGKSSKHSSKRENRRSSRHSRKQNSPPDGGSGHSSSRRHSVARRRARAHSSGSHEDEGFHGLAPAPSPARWGRVGLKESSMSGNTFPRLFPAPSPMMPGKVSGTSSKSDVAEPEFNPMANPVSSDVATSGAPALQGPPPIDTTGTAYPFQQARPYPEHAFHAPGYPPMPGMALVMDYAAEGSNPYHHPYGMAYPGFPTYQVVWDPRHQRYVYLPDMNDSHSAYQPMPNPYYHSYQNQLPYPPMSHYESPEELLPTPVELVDVGAEPVLTLTDHNLEIDIRDDQIIRSTRACLARPGFIHALVAFTVSGIVINTLSTYMDYLVRLNGVGKEYTGIVGGSFQFVIMISSLIIGKLVDSSRAYYSYIILFLVLGAFALAECGVNLDSNHGTELRWSLIIVAALVGPLQPISTELGVDVVYPLSENTVLVIQQLFSNLLSAIFIPCFKAFKHVGVLVVDEDAREHPEYTFSFYVLIVIHATATVFFATFNGRYLRYEHELEKKAAEEQRRAKAAYSVNNGGQSHYVYTDPREDAKEDHPLLKSNV